MMSHPPSSSPAGQQATSTITPTHHRSLSEHSTTNGSVAVSVNSSYNGSLRSRRPAAGVTTVKKRRFRTQSSNAVHGSRRPTNAPATLTGEGVAVSVHTHPSAEPSPTKASSSGAAEDTGKVKPTHNDAETGVVFPKINHATVQTGVPRTGQAGEGVAAAAAAAAAPHDGDAAFATPVTSVSADGGAERDLSASLPNNTSATAASSQRPMRRGNPDSMNRTAPPTTVSVKDIVHDAPSSQEAAESGSVHKTSSTVSHTSLRRRTSDVSFSLNVDDSVVLGTSKYKVSPPPPCELSFLSHKESFKSAGTTPAAAAASLAPPPSRLAPLRGSTHVGGGNTGIASSVKLAKDALGGRGSGAAQADLVTPNISRHDSAIHVAGASHSPLLSPLAENTTAVFLPRVASQLPVQASASQRSVVNSPHGNNALMRSSGDSALGEAGQHSPPAMQPLKIGSSSRSPRLQPHPPSSTTTTTTNTTTVQLPRTGSNTNITAGAAGVSLSPPPLQSVQTVSASYAAEKEGKTLQPSRHASKLGKLSLSKFGKADHAIVLPAIISLYCSPISCRNFGATCYLNSVVQCLLHTPGLLRGLDRDRQRIIKEWEAKKGGKFDEAHRRSCAERNAPATSALLDLGTARPKQDTPAPQLLLSLKAACGECNDEFAGNGQNDAHEFLITLLGVVDKEVCRSKPEAYRTMKDVEDECKRDAYARWTERLRQENDSTIYDYFGGVTGSTVQCATCSLISYRFEALLDISLPMAYNSSPRTTSLAGGGESKKGKPRPEEVVAVDLLLHDMFFSDRGEFLSGAMQVTCDRCKKLRDKTIWSTIEQWPPTLILHLKRFNNAGMKNESAVIFPYTFCPFGRVKYQLYGVCCHRGTSSFGHYTSYVYAESEASASAAVPVRSSAMRDRDAAEEADVFRSPPSGSFAKSVDGDLGDGEECDLPCGKNITPAKVQNGGFGASGSSNGSSGGASSRGGKWYFCNDESITTVTPAEVVSKTKEAYILFYRRVT